MQEALSHEHSIDQDLPQAEREIAQGFAPRVDALIEELGNTTTHIDDADYQLANGGSTVSVKKTQDFMMGNNVYPYTEVLSITILSPLEPLQARGEVTVGSPTFGTTQTGELTLGIKDCIQRMHGLIGLIEQHLHPLTQATSGANS